MSSLLTRPVLAVGLAMVVTGCGSATAHLHSTEATSSTQSTVTSTEGLTDDADQLTGVTSTAQLQNYLKALEPVRREIAKANIASHTMVRLTKSGDFVSAASQADLLSAHVGRAKTLARRVIAPQPLTGAHHSLVCAFAVGSHMSARLADDMRTLDGAGAQDLKEHFPPMEKLALRCANRWHHMVSPMLAAGGVRQPAWFHTMMNWA